MKSKKTDMQAIFSKLSERNKDILILVAKSMKIAQETSSPPANTENPQKRYETSTKTSLSVN